MANEFWKLWKTAYLHTLQKRQKWITKKSPLQKGDVVLLKDKNSKRCEWPIALIEDVKLSDDNLVRSVKVCVQRKGDKDIKKLYYDRPISDIVLLFRPEE